jgi:hypothetical protein
MDTEVPAPGLISLIGDETDAGLCVDGLCVVPTPAAADTEPEETS